MVDPDKLSEGISEYIECGAMNVVYEFVAKYVSKLYSNSWITTRDIILPNDDTK